MALADQKIIPFVSAAQSPDQEPLSRSIKVLLVKPYQPNPGFAESPPLGLLCLSASLKETFGNTVNVKVLDMKLYKDKPENIQSALLEFDADILGVSALNCEAAAAKEVAMLAKKLKPSILTVLGGPYAHKRGAEILGSSAFDWVINGPGDRVFPQAIRRFINGHDLGTDILGLCYRKNAHSIHATQSQDLIENLDMLPMPDWQHIDFDEYAKRMTMMTVKKGGRYALLFTSRGCPYLCNYCHDVFSKNFKFQSAERVLKEIEYLYDNYGITEFQIVDDIFNLHKPRLKKIMHEVHRRWPGKIYFCFPNGVRADIIDEDVLDDLLLGGTYAMAVAIETATPRLQTLIEKNLHIEKTREVIEAANKRGILTSGFFMLGFPTETKAELESTIQFALESELTLAHFFNVVPQPGTPLYPLAESENANTLKLTCSDDEEGLFYHQGAPSWYERTYGFPLSRVIARTNRRFYLSPKRMLRILKQTPPRSLLLTGVRFIQMQLYGYFRSLYSRIKTHRFFHQHQQLEGIK